MIFFVEIFRDFLGFSGFLTIFDNFYVWGLLWIFGFFLWIFLIFSGFFVDSFNFIFILIFKFLEVLKFFEI